MKRSVVSSLAALLLICACSPAGKLPEGSYLLSKNIVKINGSNELTQNDITPYIKQRPNTSLSIIGTEPVIFRENLVRSSVENIAGHLDYLGYYNSVIESRKDTSKRRISVTYTVTPGKRYRIDSVRFVLPPNPEFAEEFMADSSNISIRTGDFLSEDRLEKESVRSASHFRNLGYYTLTKNHYFFYADTLQGKTILEYHIREYTRNEAESEAVPFRKFSIGDVTISHSEQVKVNSRLLRKINRIYPGDTYSENLVNTTYERMSALRIFSGVNIEMAADDSSTVNCNIKLAESKSQGVKANIEASTNSSGLIGVSPHLNWYHKNIFHGGEWLNLGFTGNFQFKPGTDIRAMEYGANASLSIPRFFLNSIPRMEINASFNYQNRPEYKRNVVGFSFGYSGQFKKNFFYQLYPARANYVSLKDMSESFAKTLKENPYMLSMYTDHLDAGMSGSVYLTSNSDIVPRTSYHYLRFSTDLSGNLISLFSRLLPLADSGERTILGSPFYQYVRGELALGQTFRFGADDGQALALRLAGGAGYAYGNSVSMPFEQQFYVGGASSMRGWQARMLGPGASPYNTTFIIPSQTGNMKLELDVEYRFHLIWKLEGALFAEAGNVWDYHNLDRDFFKTIAADWGFGLRFDLDFILLRLDAGIKLYEPCGQIWRGPDKWFNKNGFAIHFGVGYPF